jgi:hypothetical protein
MKPLDEPQKGIFRRRGLMKAVVYMKYGEATNSVETGQKPEMS